MKLILLRNNSTHTVCTHFHKLHYHALLGLFPAAASLAPGDLATNAAYEEQSNTMSPGSSLPCEQSTPTVATSATGSTSQTSHTLPGQESPIGTQNNSPAQHIISAPATTVPSTSEPKVPKSANGEGVKNCRKQKTHPYILHQRVDSAFSVNSQVT